MEHSRRQEIARLLLGVLVPGAEAPNSSVALGKRLLNEFKDKWHLVELPELIVRKLIEAEGKLATGLISDAEAREFVEGSTNHIVHLITGRNSQRHTEVAVNCARPYPGTGSHSHKCDVCKWIWSHNDNCGGVITAHKCPICGRLQWNKYYI